MIVQQAFVSASVTHVKVPPTQTPKRTSDVIFQFGYNVNDPTHFRHEALDCAVAAVTYQVVVRSLGYHAATSSQKHPHHSKTYLKDQEWVYDKYRPRNK